MADRVRLPLRFVAGMLAAVLVLEVAARLVAPHISTPPTWGDRFTSRKAEQILGRDHPVDVVFVGSSITNAGIDPEVFVEGNRRFPTAYNAALPGATPRVNAAWIPEVVLPNLCPGVVVIGLTPRDFNDAYVAPSGYLDRYLSSQSRRVHLGQADVSDTIQAEAADVSELVRQRGNLREPFSLVSQLGGRPLDDWSDVRITATGYYRGFEEQRYREDPKLVASKRRSEFAGFAVGGREAKALRALIAESRAHGATPVVVELPLNAEPMREALPRRDEDLAAFHRSIIDVVADEEVAHLDLRTELPDPASYADLYHPNRAGTVELSRLLARELPSVVPPSGGERVVERCRREG